MTTKVTDDEILAFVSNEPISASEIGRQLGLHRSNVTPHLRRLEAARQVRMTSDKKWVLAQAQPQQTTTRLSPKQIQFYEALLDGVWRKITDDDLEKPENMRDSVILNLGDIYDDKLLNLFSLLLLYRRCRDDPDFDYDVDKIDEYLDVIRDTITGAHTSK